jgi:hypothetical protein
MATVGKYAVRLAGAAAIAVGWAGWNAGAVAADKAADAPVDFAKSVQPILKESCVKCHREDPKNPRGPAGGLKLDDKAAILKGGKAGAAVVPGKSDESLLYKVLLGDVKAGERDIHAMPKPMRNQPFKALPDAKIAIIKKWIDEGAK